MTKIKQFAYKQKNIQSIKKHPYGNNWPVVYILEGSEGRPEAYVGETNRAHKRAQDHYKNPERAKLKRMHMISDKEFNLSATKDIESRLIQYMSADGLYILQNVNSGMTDTEYYERFKYEAKFKYIWRKLRDIGLAENSLSNIENSDLFKYSPYKALTPEQQNIVDIIAQDIKRSEMKSYLVEGGPGTGKTIMSTYLVKYLVNANNQSDQPNPKRLRVGLVIPMTSLRSSLKKIFRQTKELSPGMVLSPHDVVKQSYDILVVDEAHRLKRRVNLPSYPSYDKINEKLNLPKEATQLDWIFASSRYQICFYDSEQSVQPADIRPSEIKKRSFKNYKLTNQIRVAGGDSYVKYINRILEGKKPAKQKFNNYDLQFFSEATDLIEAIRCKENQHGLARLVAGYAWPWSTKKNPETEYDFEIEGLYFKWNSTTENWVNSKNATNEVGCIHTVQGYDLNYAGVIIGPDLTYDRDKKRIDINKENYWDRNGKRSIKNPKELECYIKNIYQILLTRGMKGTYVYVVDDELRNHWKDIFS